MTDTKTAYYNGWTSEKIWEWVKERFTAMKLRENTDRGRLLKSDTGDSYEVLYTDYTPGQYPYTEKIYINGVLAQISRYE